MKLLNKKNLQLAGWLSIITSIASPLSIFIPPFNNEFYSFLLSCIFVPINIFTILVFKSLLNQKFNFFRIDKMLIGLIYSDVISIFFSFFAKIKIISSDIDLYLQIPLVIITGILMILIGKKIKKLSENLYGYRDLYAKIQIISGVCAIFIILLPLAAVLSIITWIIFGLILLKAAKKL